MTQNVGVSDAGRTALHARMTASWENKSLQRVLRKTGMQMSGKQLSGRVSMVMFKRLA